MGKNSQSHVFGIVIHHLPSKRSDIMNRITTGLLLLSALGLVALGLRAVMTHTNQPTAIPFRTIAHNSLREAVANIEMEASSTPPPDQDRFRHLLQNSGQSLLDKNELAHAVRVDFYNNPEIWKLMTSHPRSHPSLILARLYYVSTDGTADCIEFRSSSEWAFLSQVQANDLGGDYVTVTRAKHSE